MEFVARCIPKPLKHRREARDAPPACAERPEREVVPRRRGVVPCSDHLQRPHGRGGAIPVVLEDAVDCIVALEATASAWAAQDAYAALESSACGRAPRPRAQNQEPPIMPSRGSWDLRAAPPATVDRVRGGEMTPRAAEILRLSDGICVRNAMSATINLMIKPPQAREDGPARVCGAGMCGGGGGVSCNGAPSRFEV
eukprot:CAMPEP_0182866800 /NCGR_PEP_ID=MMETSP0034_2-20130328/8388_1 /TAXON_ID=156128 /ORGANISM="Nephroselmis pyriformis, Strain CCMP717" /LENGTH=196 /DNA_ID=CAMNT_0024999131 /DNA_START=191 /DNA_END=782 /DNA_ORIENTATION=-